MSEMERRALAIEELRVAQPEGKPAVIEGYAAVFNSPAEIRDMQGSFIEVILPGAFRESLESGEDILALAHHDQRAVLGRRSAGTLELREDERGLFFRIHPPDTQPARDLLVNIARRDIKGASFGFNVRAGGDSWKTGEGWMPVRSLRSVRLLDVSPVAFPAYHSTHVEAAFRSLAEWRSSESGAAEEKTAEVQATERQALDAAESRARELILIQKSF